MKPTQMGFRPIDNSSKTMLGYDLEAAHWVRAFKSAESATASTISLFQVFGLIGDIINIVVIFISIIILLLIKLYGWAFSNEKMNEDFDYVKNAHIYGDVPKILEPAPKGFLDKW